MTDLSADDLLPVWVEACETCPCYQELLRPNWGTCLLLQQQNVYGLMSCLVRRYQAREQCTRYRRAEKLLGNRL